MYTFIGVLVVFVTLSLIAALIILTRFLLQLKAPSRRGRTPPQGTPDSEGEAAAAADAEMAFGAEAAAVADDRESAGATMAAISAVLALVTERPVSIVSVRGAPADAAAATGSQWALAGRQEIMMSRQTLSGRKGKHD
jgi:hypothetical protein